MRHAVSQGGNDKMHPKLEKVDAYFCIEILLIILSFLLFLLLR